MNLTGVLSEKRNRDFRRARGVGRGSEHSVDILLLQFLGNLWPAVWIFPVDHTAQEVTFLPTALAA